MVGGQPIDLTGPIESFVSAGTLDQDGNFLIFGSGAISITNNQTTASAPLNPDNVAIAPQTQSRGAATQIWRWKISPTGQVLESLGIEFSKPVIVRSANGNLIGGSILTDTGYSGFILNWDGVNNKITQIGKSSSSVNVVMANDYLAGDSAEKLGSKNLLGKRDGFLYKISKPTYVRSTNSGAERSWISGTKSLFMGGYSTVGKNTEAVLTKFTTSFTPSWTTRFPAIGGAKVIESKKTYLAAFPIKGNKISVITFDLKGKVLTKNTITGSNVSAIGYSDESGPLLLSAGSLFRI